MISPSSSRQIEKANEVKVIDALGAAMSQGALEAAAQSALLLECAKYAFTDTVERAL